MTPPDAAFQWSAKLPVTIGIIAVVILIAGFGSWGVLTNIAGAIIASGRIEVEQHRQVIQHPDGGVVAKVHVREGDRVEQGQKLIGLEATQLQSQLAVAESQLFEVLARISRLQAERDGTSELLIDLLLAEAAGRQPEVRDLIDGQHRLFLTRLSANAQAIEQLSKRKEQVGNQVNGLEAQKNALLIQIALLDDEIAMQGAGDHTNQRQSSQVLALRRESARLQGLLGELTAQVAENEGRITETDLEILRIGTQRKEDAITQLRDLQYRSFELREDRLTLLDRLSRLDLIAPVSGHVFGLSVFAERAVIRPAEPVLFIVPDDRPLIITAQIDPLNIDEVRLGQDVTLRFSTFDRKNTPEVLGTISNISGDVFGNGINERAYYRVEMLLKEGELARLGDVALVPGMPVDAYIQTGERSPLAYLVKPLTDYFNRAFRET